MLRTSPSRTRPAALLLVFVAAACGGDDEPADAACPDAADPCTCDATRPECSGSSGASTSAPEASSEGSATTSASESSEDAATTEGAAPPPFSVLPSLGVLGARWVYDLQIEGQAPAEQVCEVTETFTWPDGTPGSTLACSSNGGQTVRETRFALYPDRVERREVIGLSEYSPAAPLYRVPLHVGDAWDVSWSHPSVGTQWSESWTVRSAGPIEVPAGTFDAIELELVVSGEGQLVDSTEWWVDGIGYVAGRYEGISSDLVTFDLP